MYEKRGDIVQSILTMCSDGIVSCVVGERAKESNENLKTLLNMLSKYDVEALADLVKTYCRIKSVHIPYKRSSGYVKKTFRSRRVHSASQELQGRRKLYF